MQKQSIFRDVALDRLSSPEQLDQLMEVTTPRGWIALGAFGVLLATALAWGVLGSVPERIQGQGILVHSGGVLEVESPSGGRISDLAVRVGDVIAEGQVVARIAQQELLDRIRQARARVQELERKSASLSAFGERDLALQSAQLAEQRSNLEKSIQASQAQLGALEERVRSQEQLVSQGLITRQTLLATMQERETVRERVRRGRSDLAQLRVQELEVRNTRQREQEENTFELDGARRELAQLSNELRLTSEVASPYTGRVLEVIAEQGSIVERGQAILTVDLTGKRVQPLEAVVFIPSVHGKKVKPGMEIQLAPSTVRREEFGYLLGRVTYVSDFPASAAGMRRLLKNDQLVTTLSGADAPYEVRAELIPDRGSPSGYRWSSSAGPPVRIQSGTLASGAIVVDRRRPIVMLIPQLRRRGDGVGGRGGAGERTAARPAALPAAGRP
jgi:HlyD family secretion protein